MMIRSSTWLRSVGALVRKDLTDVRLLLAFLLALDVAIVLLAHLTLAEEIIAFGLPVRAGAALLGLLSMTPVTAEIYSADERIGTASLLRALPVGRWTRALSKVVSVTCAIALSVAVVLLAQELLYAVGLGVSTDRLSPGVAWGGNKAEALRLCTAILGAAIVLPAILAIVLRSALVATLGPIATFVLFGIALFGLRQVGGSGPAVVVLQAVLAAGHPLGFVAMIVFVMAITSLRGRAARSVTRRAAQVLVGPLLLGSVAVAGVTLREAHRAPPAFDDPAAQLVRVEVSPDGTRVAICLWHREGVFSRSSIWMASTSTWEFTRAALPASSTLPWRLWGGLADIGSWTIDGQRLLFAIHSMDWMSHEYFAIDVGSGEVMPSSYEETILHAEYNGVPVGRTSASGRDRYVELLDGSRQSIGSNRPRVPERASETVFFCDVKGALHRLDRASGDDRVLPIEMSSRGSFEVSPDGRYVHVRHRNRHDELHDLVTGESRSLERGWGGWTRRRAVCVSKTASIANDWTLVTMDGDEAVTFEREVGALIDVDGRFWLGKSWRPASLYLFDADGSLVRTIFAGSDW